MTTTWVLVANASRARLFAHNGPNKGLQLLQEYDHPASSEKGSELLTDRPGHWKSPRNGPGSAAPENDPKVNEAHMFARELAERLEEGRTSKAYSRLILIASAPFLGSLRNALSRNTLELVSETLEKDYTRTTERELKSHLEDYIFV